MAHFKIEYSFVNFNKQPKDYIYFLNNNSSHSAKSTSMNFEHALLFTLCLFGCTNLAYTQKFLDATIIKKDGTEIVGLVHKDLIKYGKECLFKKTKTAKTVNFSPDNIQAVRFRNYYIETQRFRRYFPKTGPVYESLFLIKILDGEVDLFERGISYKEKGHYILINGRLIYIHPFYDKMPAVRNNVFKRNKTTLKILFEDCIETSKMIDKEKTRFTRDVLINLIFAYNKCKGAEQNILRH